MFWETFSGTVFQYFHKGAVMSSIMMVTVDRKPYSFSYIYISTPPPPDTGVCTQGLHLEPLSQPIFLKGFVEIGCCRIVSPGWLLTVILLISAP
jgi:hypothetical protein